MDYLCWDEQSISDFSKQSINRLYDNGYVLTRKGKGIMHQTRSLRVNLSKFELTSENRRVLRKTDGLQLTAYSLPLTDYHWSIGKMAKNFYDTKFGSGAMSANKIKELLTDEKKNNFNLLLQYSLNAELRTVNEPLGYAICHENSAILHYAYPFYELRTLNSELKDVGMGMMLRAILYAQKQGKKYIYLGSFQRLTDTYKLQFEGLEWFDVKTWKTNVKDLKNNL